MKDIKVVTICGSMKFKDEMQKIAVTLETKKKYAVLSCVFPPRDVSLSQDEINDLGLLHLKKLV